MNKTKSLHHGADILVTETNIKHTKENRYKTLCQIVISPKGKRKQGQGTESDRDGFVLN